MKTNYPWHSFLYTADEWIVNYIMPPYPPHFPFFSVKLFSIGHALELYLKATNAKLTGDIEQTIKYGHNLINLWKDCKKIDPLFLPNYELRQQILDRNLLKYTDYSKLSEDDQQHYADNQEFYIIMKHLPDMKYLGAPLKSLEDMAGLVLMFPNDYWIILFKDIRNYLHYPIPKTRDKIKVVIDDKAIPLIARTYLSKLYPPNQALNPTWPPAS